MITAGTKPGQYQILSKIGADGMGEVYLAQDDPNYATAHQRYGEMLKRVNLPG